MNRAPKVMAYDSGMRVAVEIDPEAAVPLCLSIGVGDDVPLTVEEAERVILALRAGLSRLEAIRSPK